MQDAVDNRMIQTEKIENAIEEQERWATFVECYLA